MSPHGRITLATFMVALLGLVVHGAGAAPEAGAQTTAAVPADSCPRIAEDIARTELQRKQAVEQGESAWKLVLPFAVLARKASSQSGIEAADRQLVVLRQRAGAEGCGGGAGEGLALRCSPRIGIEQPLGRNVDCAVLR